MQTEFELPKGYVDQNGDIHKRGTIESCGAHHREGYSAPQSAAHPVPSSGVRTYPS